MLADRAWENSHLPDCCAYCTNGKNIEPLVVVVSPLNALISDQLESCQRLKLKAVKMEQELFGNDDKRTELDQAEVVYCSPETLENIQSKQFLVKMDDRLVGIVVVGWNCCCRASFSERSYFVTSYQHHVIARSLSRGACSI